MIPSEAPVATAAIKARRIKTGSNIDGIPPAHDQRPPSSDDAQMYGYSVQLGQALFPEHFVDGSVKTVSSRPSPLDATAVLGAVPALRVTSAPHGCALAFASTPRSAGPSGMDGASAQREQWRLRDGRLIAPSTTSWE
jgi:hypothetical protein